ncbi:unnamed protein product, partial [Prorocentrum cordatum]
ARPAAAGRLASAPRAPVPARRSRRRPHAAARPRRGRCARGPEPAAGAAVRGGRRADGRRGRGAGGLVRGQRRRGRACAGDCGSGPVLGARCGAGGDRCAGLPVYSRGRVRGGAGALLPACGGAESCRGLWRRAWEVQGRGPVRPGEAARRPVRAVPAAHLRPGAPETAQHQPRQHHEGVEQLRQAGLLEPRPGPGPPTPHGQETSSQPVTGAHDRRRQRPPRDRPEPSIVRALHHHEGPLAERGG